MKKVILLSLVMLLYICANAQSGIQFEQGLDWSQILRKAKAENKYIFVDCFATWCGPCKMMDEEIYPLKQVGDVFNKQFISVKLQIDKTSSDNEETKQWYPIASRFESNYTINAYPTFLFFAPDGQPLHKVSGSKNSADFINLAGDARNPEKQYYTIVKNFQPGKLDTAELKGLARMFNSSDKGLAERMAVDYLSRIPRSVLKVTDNQQFVIQFQNNPKVLDIALAYVKSLNRKEFSKAENLSFILKLTKQEKAKNIAIDYISKLKKREFGKEINLEFVSNLNNDLMVQQFAKNYIDNLSKKELFTKKNIAFLSRFTTTPNDRGFDILYRHSSQVNTVMGVKGYSEGKAANVIKNAEITPLLNQAKEKEVQPDFKVISEGIVKKYNVDLAERVIISSKMDWYNYLVYTKREDKYRPELINSFIVFINKFKIDTIAKQSYFVNNLSYSEIFLHSSDKVQLSTAISWMRNMVDRDTNYMFLDTYASLLYKSGNINDGIEWEQKALQIAISSKSKTDIQYANNKIEAMKKGEKIWLKKEFQ